MDEEKAATKPPSRCSNVRQSISVKSILLASVFGLILWWGLGAFRHASSSTHSTVTRHGVLIELSAFTARTLSRGAQFFAKHAGSDFAFDVDEAGGQAKVFRGTHLFHSQSPQQSIDVYQHATLGHMLFVNQSLLVTEADASSQHEMMVHAAMSYLPHATRALVIGGGDGQSVKELLKHANLVEIHQVDRNRDILNAVRRYFSGLNATYRNPRVKLTTGSDVRTILRRKDFRASFDFVMVESIESMDPGSVASLMHLSRLLKPRGVLLMEVDTVAPHKAASLGEDFEVISSIFKDVSMFVVRSSSMQHGANAYAFCTQSFDPLREPIDWANVRDKKLPLQYYNSAVHYSAFAVPRMYLDRLGQSVADVMPYFVQHRPSQIQFVELSGSDLSKEAPTRVPPIRVLAPDFVAPVVPEETIAPIPASQTVTQAPNAASTAAPEITVTSEPTKTTTSAPAAVASSAQADALAAAAAVVASIDIKSQATPIQQITQAKARVPTLESLLASSASASDGMVLVNGTGWQRVEPMVLHPVAFEALSDMNRGVARKDAHKPFADQCKQQIFQRLCIKSAAIEELIDSTDCTFWEFIVIYRQLISEASIVRDVASGAITLGKPKAGVNVCPDPAMVEQLAKPCPICDGKGYWLPGAEKSHEHHHHHHHDDKKTPAADTANDNLTPEMRQKVAEGKKAAAALQSANGGNRHNETLFDRFSRLYEQRPTNVDNVGSIVVDQLSVSVIESLIHASFMHERGNLIGKRILVIGDDDLFSLAAALTGLPAWVVVLEKDPRLVAFLNHVARTENLPMLEAYVYDAQQPLDEKKYKRQFDVVLTDPPDTLEAFSIWISRASLALKGANSALYMGLTSVEAAVTKWFRMQQVAIAARFVITDLRRKFTRYANNPKPVNATVSTQTLKLNITGLPSASQREEQVLVSVTSDVHRDDSFVATNSDLTPDAKNLGAARTVAPASAAPSPKAKRPLNELLLDETDSLLTPTARKLLGIESTAPASDSLPTSAAPTAATSAAPSLSPSSAPVVAGKLKIPPEVLAYFAERGEKLDLASGSITQDDIDVVAQVIKNEAIVVRETKRREQIEKLQEAAVGGEVIDLERGNLEFIPELRPTNVTGPADAGADAVWFTSAFIRMVAVDDERPLIISNTLIDFGETLYIDRDQYPTYNDGELTELRQKVLTNPLHPVQILPTKDLRHAMMYAAKLREKSKRTRVAARGAGSVETQRKLKRRKRLAQARASEVAAQRQLAELKKSKSSNLKRFQPARTTAVAGSAKPTRKPKSNEDLFALD